MADDTAPHPADEAARVRDAQARVYARYADLAEAEASRAAAQAEFSEALTGYHRAVDALIRGT